MLRTISTISAVFLLSATLIGCAGKKTVQESELELFQSSQDLMAKGKYHIAVLRQELFEQRYPFSQYAEKNQLDLIFSRYKNQQLEDTIVIADRFMRLNPDHPEVGYAWYVKALATYDISRSNRSFFSGKDITLRDPSQAKEAYDLFDGYIQNFPDGKYVPDARIKQIDIRNRLATYHIRVAEFYLERKAWVASINRAKKVLADFPGSPSVLDALSVLQAAYTEIGETQLSQQAKSELDRLAQL